MISFSKKHILLSVCACMLASTSAINAEEVDTQYRRSSLYSVLVSRTDQNMYDRIQEQYLQIPVPAQYNDHNLSIRIVNVDKKGEYKDSVQQWIDDNQIASRMVAKWFDRDILSGDCSLDLIKQRGLYNATELDKELASRSARGKAILEDAGEELIGNTFLIVNEAHYIDNAKRSKNVATGLRIFGAVAGAFLGSGISDLFDSFGDIAETFKGFRVKIHTRLYQLVWNDETSSQFYEQMYTSTDSHDVSKARSFENNRDKFKLVYVGEVESAGSQNSFLGISEEHPEIMIRKACCRAIDDNIADLQRNFEQFRVKSPIKGIEGSEVKVAIGMKEGINKSSEYEVLEPQEKNGKIEYKRVGVIVPVEDKIWDNRFMAYEEGAVGSDLDATTFKVKSGKVEDPGLFVRQIK